MNSTILNPEELAFAFPCQGDELIGFLHKGNPNCDIGVLAIVAGGPQYRAGVGRQLLNLGRQLASEGISVMRFDHRGVGDSSGTFRRFDAMQDDIKAAIDEFKRQSPNVRGVILWGGCDAATSALINAHKFPDVVGTIAANPFVSSSVTATKAARKHYLSRLMERSFWTKVIRMEYNILEYVRAAIFKSRGRNYNAGNSAKKGSSEASGNYINALLKGMRDFKGKVLFLMGDRFLLSDEFDLLMDSNSEWRSVYKKSTHERIDIKGGDQVFSSTEAQDRVFRVASEWIHGAFPESFKGCAGV